MSVGPMAGLASSVAATSLAQTAGSELERSQQASAVQERRLRNEQRATSAAGIGEADGQDHETGERDADGRRLWERSHSSGPRSEPSAGTPASKDATRQSGNLIDLSG